MNLLVTGTIPDDTRATLETLGFRVTVRGTNDLVDEETFKKEIPAYDVYISGGYESSTAAVIKVAKKLRLIIFLGADAASYIDIAAAKRQSIVVCNTPGANAESVAQLTVGLLLSLMRQIGPSSENLKRGNWDSETVLSLENKRVGLIGFGHVAARVARILGHGFSCPVSYWSKSRKKDTEKSTGAQYVGSLAELLSSSEIVSLHVPASSGCILGKDQFRQLRPGAFLINTAPAELVDAESLLNALETNTIAGAAFDGLYSEGTDTPSDTEKALLQFPQSKFLATPHIAWRTKQADQNMYNMALESVKALLARKPIPNRLS